MKKTTKLKLAYYIFKIFSDFIFIYPYYALMMREQGITDSGYSTLMIIWVLPIFIFEVPSGIIADKYNRKAVIVVGQLIRSFGYLTWVLKPDFIGFAIGFICWGLASTLRSGALEALIYDNLLAINQEDQFSKIESKSIFFKTISIAIVTLLSSYLIDYGFELLIYLSLISLLICILAILTIKDHRLEDECSVKNKSFIAIFKEGSRDLFQDKALVFLTVLGVVFMISGMLDEYWGLLLEDLGYSYSVIGKIILIIMIVESSTMLLIPKFENNKNFSFFILIGGLLLLSTAFNGIIVIVCFIIFNSFFKLYENVISIRFQKTIDSGARATVTSFKGVLEELLCIGYYGLIGGVTNYFDLTSTMVIMGGLLVIMAFVIYVNKSKSKYLFK